MNHLFVTLGFALCSVRIRVTFCVSLSKRVKRTLYDLSILYFRGDGEV